MLNNRKLTGGVRLSAPRLALVCSLLISMFSALAVAEDVNLNQLSDSINRSVMELKTETLALDQELYLLDQQIRYPDQTRMVFFLRLADRQFNAQNISLAVDNIPVITRDLTVDEANSLRRGGSLRVTMANGTAGPRRIQATLKGQTLNRNGKPTDNASVDMEATINKGIEPHTVELILERRRRWIFQRIWTLKAQSWASQS